MKSFVSVQPGPDGLMNGYLGLVMSYSQGCSHFNFNQTWVHAINLDINSVLIISFSKEIRTLFLLLTFLSYPHCIADRWGTIVDFITNSLHFIAVLISAVWCSSEDWSKIWFGLPSFSSVASSSPSMYFSLQTVLTITDRNAYHLKCAFSLKSGGLHTARWRFQFVFHNLTGYLISFRDTEGFAETCPLQCLHLSFNVNFYGTHFTCIQRK